MTRYALILALLAGLALIACGGSREDVSDREISDDALATMVLHKHDFGIEFANFDRESDSGFRSNEEAIVSSFDEEDERQDIARFGRTNGYMESYGPGGSAPEDAVVFSIGTSVSLFKDAEGASGDMKDDVQDWKRYVGTNIGQLRLEAADEFDPGDIGDEASGQTLTFRFPGSESFEIHVTTATFRRGRLTGTVFLASFEKLDLKDADGALLQSLDDRMVQVLEGRLAVRPQAAASPR